ncbi:hypothetical protein [Paenibacillus harenae]|uniref:Uncharacterized protein n=1 Tax=Paenibacillus harenae TaxID=306543 RepID=A0ABT9U2R1_PAEHA|nr:hypothetical protein [Paenibacillus harenae]MDQ0113910.1 hypothetical protein [Paenibacillus harenae]
MEEQKGTPPDAKALFVQYKGNKVAMHRADVLESYKTYDISIEEENEWYAEIIDSLANKLSIMNWEAVTELEALAKYYPSPPILERVVSFADRHISGADSLVRLVYAEKMTELIQTMKRVITTEALHSVSRTAVRIFQDIIAKPLIVDEGHSMQVFQLRDKRSLNNRCKIGLDRIEELLN